jgi:cephalosporin-C deacetylase
MPMVDMSLKELSKYNGTNPKPKDFDLYWDKGLDQIKTLDAHLELKPARFSSPVADCMDLYFTGLDSSRIYAKYLKPKNESKPCPTLFFWHGYSGSSGDWTSYLALAASGFCVCAMDCRGQGGKSEDLGGVPGNTLSGHITRGMDGGPENLLYRKIFLDTAQLINLVLNFNEVDETRMGSAGGSQGGALALVAASLSPQIKKVYSQFPFLCDYKRVWEMDKSLAAYEDIRTYLRKFDPRHEKIEKFFINLGYIDVQHLVKRIKGEVLMITGLMDEICPPSTQFAAYNKIKAKKNMLIYPDYGHEGYPDQGDIQYEFFLSLHD